MLQEISMADQTLSSPQKNILQLTILRETCNIYVLLFYYFVLRTCEIDKYIILHNMDTSVR